MARKALPIDLLDVSTVSKLTTQRSLCALRVYSPAHSVSERPKHFDFRFMKDAGAFGPIVASVFVECIVSKQEATATGIKQSVEIFFRYVLRKIPAERRASIGQQSQMEWQTLVDSYALAIKANRSLKDVTKNYYLGNVRFFYEQLRRRNAVPPVKWPQMIANAKRTPRLPLSQVVLEQLSQAQGDKDDQKIWSRLLSLNDLARPSVEKERIALINSLVRKYAEREARAAWLAYRNAQALIVQNTSFDFVSYCKAFECNSDGRIARRRGWRAELSTFENALVYIDKKFGGVVPGKSDDPCFRKFVDEEHRSRLKYCFHLEYETLIPFLALLLQARPKMNVSSPLEMSVDDVTYPQGNDIRATWTKKRANYLRLRDFIPKGRPEELEPGSELAISPGQALYALSELSRRLRPYAITGMAKRLILVRHTYAGHAASHSPRLTAVSKAWTAFRKRSGPLALTDFSLSQFRPTAAVEEFLTSGDITKVQAQLGQVNTQHTVRYISGLAAAAVDNDAVRDVQDALGLLLAQHGAREISDFAIDEARAREIAKAADSAGFLGYRLSSESSGCGSPLSSLQRTLTHSTQLINDTPEIAAEFIAFKDHVIENGRSIRGTPRYEAVWLPLVAILAELLENMSPNTLLAARKILEEQPLSYGPVL